jgi:hypothetical protein
MDSRTKLKIGMPAGSLANAQRGGGRGRARWAQGESQRLRAVALAPATAESDPP